MTGFRRRRLRTGTALVNSGRGRDSPDSWEDSLGRNWSHPSRFLDNPASPEDGGLEVFPSSVTPPPASSKVDPSATSPRGVTGTPDPRTTQPESLPRWNLTASLGRCCSASRVRSAILPGRLTTESLRCGERRRPYRETSLTLTSCGRWSCRSRSSVRRWAGWGRPRRKKPTAIPGGLLVARVWPPKVSSSGPTWSWPSAIGSWPVPPGTRSADRRRLRRPPQRRRWRCGAAGRSGRRCWNGGSEESELRWDWVDGEASFPTSAARSPALRNPSEVLRGWAASTLFSPAQWRARLDLEDQTPRRACSEALSG